MVDSGRPDLPHGVTPVLLRADENLAREWSVAMLTPTFGGSVVAQDLDDVDPSATSVEAARRFQGRRGFRRDEAYAEVVRLRDALGDRLPPGWSDDRRRNPRNRHSRPTPTPAWRPWPGSRAGWARRPTPSRSA